MKPICRIARFLFWVCLTASLIAFWMVVVDETFSKHVSKKNEPVIQNVPYNLTYKK